jgi:hypothetical protein
VARRAVSKPTVTAKLDLLRTARYYLELCRRYPHDEIMPIALVDDDKPFSLENTIQRGVGGHSYMTFETRVVQIPGLEMDAYRDTCNRVALSFLPNMRGSRRMDAVLDVVLAFHQAGDQEGVRLLFAFWVVEGDALSKRSAPKGRLNVEQQKELNRILRERDMPEIMDWLLQEGVEKGIEQGLEQGLRQNALENARKMLAEGFDWSVVTRITGIKPEDLA